MSFILDALRKSENERQQQSGGEFSAVPTGAAASGPPRWIWVLAILLAINVAVMLGLLMRPDVRTPSTAAFEDVVLPAPVPEAETEPAVAAAPTFEQQLAEARQQAPVTVADTPAAETVAAAPLATPAPAAARSERVPTIEELRLSGALQLPELHIDIHVYSERPADRFVFINMTKYREQSQLDEGPVVREITAEGVILQHQGRTFLLSRE